MVEVAVTYKGAALTLNFPQNWNELTREQLLYIARNWEGWKELAKAEQSLFRARSELMLQLCGLKKRGDLKTLCQWMTKYGQQKTADIDLIALGDWVFEKQDLTKQLLPKIRVGWFSSVFGPGDRLNDIDIEEFSFAFAAYGSYMRTQKDEDLNNLVAVLYRPASDDFHKTGDIREPFVVKKIAARARKISAVPYQYKQAVLLYFIGCMELLRKRYKHVFSGAKKEGEASGAPFYDTVMGMAGDIFGDLDKTNRTNVHLFLKRLDKLIEKQKNRRKKQG
jgi:hypothetical protein